MTPQNEKNLERLVTNIARGLPPRHAPHTLEARVLAEIARRAALPWWRKSFVHWPLAARAALVVACAGMIELLLMVTQWASAGVHETEVRAFAPGLQWLRAGEVVLGAVREAITGVVTILPPLWLYGAAAVIGASYLMLVGLGAAAYRTLHTSS